MMWRRLDFYATGGAQFHKPRRGRCPLCAYPVLNHPCWPHRRAAITALLTQRITR
jgi:hypothetical protein